MKAERFGGKKGFQKFDIILTVESEEEAKALFAIFNYSGNVDLLTNETGQNIRKAIGEEYGNLGPLHLIARGVHFTDFYRSKRFS